MSTLNLIDLPVQALLEKFGAGGHKPGSGSAAALVGILAGKLISTVAVLTKQKKAYSAVYPEVDFIVQQITNRIEPALYEAFQRDAEVFDQVIEARRQRDAETDPKRKRQFDETARKHLRVATEIPMEVCRNCLSLVDLGISMFNIGFRSARGDSGAAVSVALAGAFSALFVVYLNLTQLRQSEWKRNIQGKADELYRSAEALQESLFSRVTALRSEGTEDPQLQLPLE